MLIPYWTYAIGKNWDGRIAGRTADTNIFCYGKPNTNKTEIIGRSCLLRAIEEGRSALLYTEDLDLYEDVLSYASNKNIDIYDIDVNEELDDEDDIKALQAFPYEQIIVCIHNEKFRDPCQFNNLDKLLDQWDDACREKKPEKLTHIILDGVCGNVYIRSRWLNNKALKFCIIMDCDIASPYVRGKLCNNIVKAAQEKGVETTAINSFIHDNSIRGMDYAMQRFSRPIETLLCTGVNGVRPQDHKEFVGHVFFNEDSMKLAGKFIVEEKITINRAREMEEFFQNKRHVKPIEIQDDIENSDYGDLAQYHIMPRRWIIELNGRIHCFHDRRAYIPVCLSSAFEAELWIKSQLERKNIENYQVSKNDEAIIFSFPRTCTAPLESNEIGYFNISNFCTYRDGLKKNSVDDVYEITAIRISEKDLQSLRMNYLLTVLEYGELNANAQDLVKYLEVSVGDNWEESICENDFFERLLKWIDEKSRPAETVESTTYEVPEEYRWKGYVAAQSDDITADKRDHRDPMDILPQDGVLFLGGHQNMTKKLKQLFPNWTFITDDVFKRGNMLNAKIVFYWTGHSSHTMTQFVNARKATDTPYIYVTATNIDRLVNEMAEKYLNEIE